MINFTYPSVSSTTPEENYFQQLIYSPEPAKGSVLDKFLKTIEDKFKVLHSNFTLDITLQYSPSSYDRNVLFRVRTPNLITDIGKVWSVESILDCLNAGPSEEISAEMFIFDLMSECKAMTIDQIEKMFNPQTTPDYEVNHG